MRLKATTVLLFILASAPLANALEECADFFVVSYNQQKLVQSLVFDSGNPSTITLKSLKSGTYYWFPQDHNESNSFDVVVAEPYGFLKQGEIVFREAGEQKWYSKEKGDKVYYNCTAEGKGLTDWFTFSFLKEKEIALSDGTTMTANFSLVSSNNASNAFTFPDGTVASDFLVLTQNMVRQNLVQYKAGTVFFKTGKGHAAITTLNGYPRVQYVGCCATRLAPTAVPTPSPSASPSPTLVPSPTPSLSTPSPSASPSPSPLPSPSSTPQPQQQFNYSGIMAGIVLIIVLIALVAFAFKLKRK